MGSRVAEREAPRSFVALESLKGRRPRDAAAALGAIRRIYFETTARTIEHDLAQAIELLKSMPSEEDRDRAAVYMEGLAQMRSEWAGRRKKGPANSKSQISKIKSPK